MVLLSRIKHSENFMEASEFQQTVTRVHVASMSDFSQWQILWVYFWKQLRDKNNAINI